MTFQAGSFREYDIRGVADRDLDDQTVRALGVAFGKRAATYGRSVVVGRDPRLHSDRLFAALCHGLRTSVDVIDIGVGPTPLLYFAEKYLAPAAAVMITGSHNPAEDNGFKLLLGGKSFFGANLQALASEVAVLLQAPASLDAVNAAHALTSQDLVPAYLQAATAALQIGPRRPRVVVDGGNGAGGPLATTLYRRLGFDVVALYCEMDGRFPNHHPDPTVPENLQALIAKVQATDAELGIALDGDADRIGAVDKTGRILWGDQLMLLFGQAILRQVPNAKFVGEVKCSQTMFDGLRAAGGQAEMWKVGHSLIKTRMLETGAALAGEMSGHMFFAHRWFGFDDAVYAGGRLLELLSSGPATLADLAAALPVVANTPELRLPCADHHKFAVVSQVASAMRQREDVTSVIDIDGVRANFGDGWGLVRASNTQPVIVMRCEANDQVRLAAIRAIMETAVAQASATLASQR